MNDKGFPELKIAMDKAIAFKSKKGFTYDDLGQALGCTRSHVHRVFTLQTFPSVQFLIQLARFMGISLAELCSSEDEGTKPTDDERRLELIQLLLEEMGFSSKEVKNVMNYIKGMK